MSDNKATILIIDDDPNVILGLRNLLEEDYDVVGAGSGEEGVRLHNDRRHDVIILDMQMQGLDGYQTGARIREIDPLVPIIVNTGYTKLYSRSEVEKALDPFAYLVKGEYDPSNIVLETTVASALKYRKALKKVENYDIIERQNQEIRQKNKQLESASQTERQLRDQLVQKARFETMAAVSRGVLHDVRNLVAALSSTTRMLIDPYRQAQVFVNELQSLETNVDANTLPSRLNILRSHPFLESLSGSSSRAEASVNLLHKIVSVLGTLETDYQLEFRDVSIERVLDSAIASVGQQTELSQIIRRYDAAGQYVFYGDVIQLERLFANLILNAYEAMANQTQRRLCLSTTLQFQKVIVTIADNGPGVPAELQDRVFDAYVSTKEMSASRERGLGLYVASIIVKGHGGEISVANAPAGGAAFVVVLPTGDLTT